MTTGFTQQPFDLLEVPIEEGSIVTWAVGGGRGAVSRLGKVLEIILDCENNRGEKYYRLKVQGAEFLGHDGHELYGTNWRLMKSTQKVEPDEVFVIQNPTQKTLEVFENIKEKIKNQWR